MKAVAKLGFGIASAVGACVAAASVASLVMADSQPRGIVNIAASDLWTTKPIAVDPATQSYERLPPVLSTYAANPPRIARPAPRAAASIPVAENQAAADADHLNWCASRYKSFNAGTNSYRSYSGEVRTCVSPFERSPVASLDTPEQQAPSSVDLATQAWCAARYQSYQPADNTYQPYDGPRRACEGPRADDQVASRY